MSDKRRDELVESWINGNRKWVMDELAGMPVMQAVHMAVCVDRRLTDPECRRTFLSMIERRASP